MYRSVSQQDVQGDFRDVTMKDIEYSISNFTREQKMKLFDVYLSTDRTSNIDIVAGLPGTINAFFFHSSVRQTYHRHCLYQLIHEYEIKTKKLKHLLAAFYEILSKGLIYKELKPNIVIFVHSTLAYYVKSICVTARGFTCAWLTRVKGSEVFHDSIPLHILCVCGSQFHPSGLDALSFYKTDLEEYIGKEAFDASSDFLDQVFDYLEEWDEKVVLCGHSLGGALVQLIATKYAASVQKLIFYNAPGIPDRFHEKLRLLGIRFKIENHCTIGDIVFRSGGYHLGWKNPKLRSKFYLYELDKSFYWARHTYICIANPMNFMITVTKSKDPKLFEELHSYPLEVLRYIFSFSNALLFGALRGVVRSIVPSRAEMIRKETQFASVWDEF